MNIEELKIEKCFICDSLIYYRTYSDKGKFKCYKNCIWIDFDLKTYKILYFGIINSFYTDNRQQKLYLFKDKYFLLSRGDKFWTLTKNNIGFIGGMKIPLKDSIEYIYDLKCLDLKSFFINTVNKFEKIQLFI